MRVLPEGDDAPAHSAVEAGVPQRRRCPRPPARPWALPCPRDTVLPPAGDATVEPVAQDDVTLALRASLQLHRGEGRE